MKINFLKKGSIIKYFWSFIIVFVTSFTSIYFYLIWQYNINNSISILKTQSSRIEKSFLDGVDYTAYLMHYLNSQIKDNNKYSDLKYIDNLLSSFRLNQDVNNKIPWNMFSWIDQNSNLVVNSDRGIVKSIDVSDRDYLHAAIKNPMEVHLGKITYGRVSSKQIIPAGMAVSDAKGRIMGVMVFGIQTDKLIYKLNDSLSAYGVSFAFFDQDAQMIFNSSDFPKSPNISKKVSAINLDKSKSGVLTNFSFFSENLTLSYYQKIDKYPYILVLSYDDELLKKELLAKVVPYFFELLLIFSILLVIIFGFKKLVINPISQLSEMSRLIASNSQIQALELKSKIPEINQLSKSIFSIRNFINTEQSLKQQLKKANQAKTTLLKSISHDLRNYISGISGLAEIIVEDISDKKLDKKNKELQDGETPTVDLAKLIIKQSNRMLGFTKDILNTNITELGIINVEEEEDCDVRELIEEMLILNRHFVKDQQVKIITNFQENLPNLRCDRRRFRQVIDNLITNAVKYSKKGGEVKIGCQFLDADGNNKMYITIADNGIGMSKEDIKELLEGRGKDLDKSDLDKPIDSHGIGMQIVMQLIKVLGAKIEIESEKKKGTLVKLWFGVNKNYQLDFVKVENKNKQVKSGSKSSKTIIIADDEEVNLMILERVLIGTKHRIIKAKNGEKILEILNKERCDLIFMDIKMPKLDGFEVAKIIRSGKTIKDKEHQNIPLVAISGNTDAQTIKKASLIGINKFIGKPFIKKEVLDLVKELLG